MVDGDTKMPWESKTELTAFIGVVAMLAASFGLIELSPEQIAGIGSVLFVVIMIVRAYWPSAAKIAIRK